MIKVDGYLYKSKHKYFHFKVASPFLTGWDERKANHQKLEVVIEVVHG